MTDKQGERGLNDLWGNVFNISMNPVSMNLDVICRNSHTYMQVRRLIEHSHFLVISKAEDVEAVKFQ